MTALDTPATPAQLAAARTPIGDRAYVETVVASLTRAYWQGAACPRCRAVGDEPCRKPSGRRSERHAGRVS